MLLILIIYIDQLQQQYVAILGQVIQSLAGFKPLLKLRGISRGATSNEEIVDILVTADVSERICKNEFVPPKSMAVNI